MIYNQTSLNYDFDPQRAYDFTPYIDELKGLNIHYGHGPNVRTNDKNFRVKFFVEHPNCLYENAVEKGCNIDENNELYDLVLSLCPFTNAYLNDKYKTDKYVTCFWPLKELEYVEKDRPYPVFYSGHYIPDLPIMNMIWNTVNHYLGESTFENLRSQLYGKIVCYYRKLEILSQTKICIAHNILQKNLFGMRETDEFCKKHLPWHTDPYDHSPQIKSRIFEGAMMGCILLIYKDKYNMAEMYFTENEDFLYYTDETDLRNKIDMILADYMKYKYLGENAQRKFYSNYTFRHFVDFIKSESSKRMKRDTEKILISS
jgi:hypothetical protein